MPPPIPHASTTRPATSYARVEPPESQRNMDYRTDQGLNVAHEPIRQAQTLEAIRGLAESVSEMATATREGLAPLHALAGLPDLVHAGQCAEIQVMHSEMTTVKNDIIGLKTGGIERDKLLMTLQLNMTSGFTRINTTIQTLGAVVALVGLIITASFWLAQRLPTQPLGQYQSQTSTQKP